MTILKILLSAAMIAAAHWFIDAAPIHDGFFMFTAYIAAGWFFAVAGLTLFFTTLLCRR